MNNEEKKKSLKKIQKLPDSIISYSAHTPKSHETSSQRHNQYSKSITHFKGVPNGKFSGVMLSPITAKKLLNCHH